MLNGIIFPDVAESLGGVMENRESLLDAQISLNVDLY